MDIHKMAAERTVARNLLQRQIGLNRTTASIIASRWSTEEVLAVVNAPIGDLNQVLIGITPKLFLPQSWQEKVAVANSFKIPEVQVKEEPTPADEM